MNESALLSYLRRRGINNISEKEFTDKLHEIMGKSEYSSSPKSMLSAITGMGPKEQVFHGTMTESEAKEVVAKMWHYHHDEKDKGEHFSMYKAKEICEMYHDILPSNVKYPEIYVAINAQYHDMGELFKHWFGYNVDSKLIESALVFWFGDVDYPHASKVAKYFKD
jgi:hypothetical protein